MRSCRIEFTGPVTPPPPEDQSPPQSYLLFPIPCLKSKIKASLRVRSGRAEYGGMALITEEYPFVRANVPQSPRKLSAGRYRMIIMYDQETTEGR